MRVSPNVKTTWLVVLLGERIWATGGSALEAAVNAVNQDRCRDWLTCSGDCVSVQEVGSNRVTEIDLDFLFAEAGWNTDPLSFDE